ncbi:MAG: hypothetical protein K2G63_07405 [Oscillospiraceae bacterium]|nr:hypothetical protein [Oscillospiraceae bacterium]
MKKVGDLLTASGIVEFIFVGLELIMDWKMLPNETAFFFFVIGSLIILLIGIIMRSISKSKESKSEKN